MSVYDLYAINVKNLIEARLLIEGLLNCTLEERDSSYHGGIYYHWGDDASEHFMLKVNRDPFDDEATEEAFPDAAFLFYIHDTNRSSTLQISLEKGGNFVELLRHEDLVNYGDVVDGAL
jgi:hypothetical protein